MVKTPLRPAISGWVGWLAMYLQPTLQPPTTPSRIFISHWRCHTGLALGWWICFAPQKKKSTKPCLILGARLSPRPQVCIFGLKNTATFYNREGRWHQGSGSSSQRLQYMILVPKRTQLCNGFTLGAWRIILSDLDTWIGSPPFFSHEKAVWKGNNPIFRELMITMVNNHLLNGMILQVVGWIQFIMLDLDKLATGSASHQSHHEQKNRQFHDGLQCLSITKGSIIH